MKNLIKLSFLLISSTFFISCEGDDLGGDGDTRDVFEGQWTVSEDSKLLGNRNYIIEIDLSAEYSSRINLFDFYKLGVKDSIYGNVSSVLAEAITIPNQYLKNNLIHGNGTLVNDNLINFTYYVDDGNDIDTVDAVFTR